MNHTSTLLQKMKVKQWHWWQQTINTVTKKNHLTFFFHILISSLHIQIKSTQTQFRISFILDTTIIILSKHLVLSAYLVTAATVSDFSFYLICFIYTAKFWHQQDVYLTKKLIHWNTFYFFHFYIFHYCSTIYSIYVSFSFQVCWSFSFQWNECYWLFETWKIIIQNHDINKQTIMHQLLLYCNNHWWTYLILVWVHCSYLKVFKDTSSKELFTTKYQTIILFVSISQNINSQLSTKIFAHTVYNFRLYWII
jgi:hypothetical protein